VLLRWSRELVSVKRKGAIWIMVGRPRKIGKRERNGRIARTYENPKAQVAAQPHRQSVPKQFREWPEAESEFGRLLLRGGVTRSQYDAGIRFAELSVALCAVYDVPSPYPHAMDLTRVRGAMGPGMPSEQARKIKDAYMAAFDASMEAGRVAHRAVKDHVVLDKPVGDLDSLTALSRGLSRLVDHFGLDARLQIRFRQKCR
jgi:hypothetical protein